MPFRELYVKGTTGYVSLDKDDLRRDGVVENNTFPDQQEMHVERIGDGVYVVRVVSDGNSDLPDLADCDAIEQIAASQMLELGNTARQLAD